MNFFKILYFHFSLWTLHPFSFYFADIQVVVFWWILSITVITWVTRLLKPTRFIMYFFFFIKMDLVKTIGLNIYMYVDIHLHIKWIINN